uniref:Charged multivesicular body protein 3 n=1 Tax=Cacopsylla melanoneura TaxID=428564 RepID=A0A8D8VFF0_9HEMI
MGLFGKTHEKDPKEQVNEWCHKIRKEGYQLDRQIRSIEREEDKVKKALKEAAKKNDKDVCITLAKEIVNARKHITKIHTSKAHLNSIQLQMKNQLSLLRVSGSIQKSTEVMQAMQRLVNVPEVAATMREMSKEMMKAGIMEEMIEETMESIEPDVEDMEEQAQEEIDKVLWELTAGALGKVPAVGTDTPSSTKEKHEEAVGGADEEEDQDDLEAMKSRLEALRS